MDIKYWNSKSIFYYSRSCNDFQKSISIMIHFYKFFRNSDSFSLSVSLLVSLSSLSLLVSLGEASRTRIETMAEKRYRGTGASWQGRTTTSRMLLYVGNTSFILRSISVSTLERKPPCPLFSTLPLPLSLSRFLLFNSVSTRSFDFSRNFSRNIGVSRLVVRRNYVYRRKSWTWGLTRLKDFICYFRCVLEIFFFLPFWKCV